MTKNTAPCYKNCPDRAAGCHGKCGAYLDFRAELDKQKAERDVGKGEMTSYYRCRRARLLHNESRKAK